jgi:hypothetical protein
MFRLKLTALMPAYFKTLKGQIIHPCVKETMYWVQLQSSPLILKITKKFVQVTLHSNVFENP